MNKAQIASLIVAFIACVASIFLSSTNISDWVVVVVVWIGIGAVAYYVLSFSVFDNKPK